MVTKMVQETEGYMQGKITNTYERILAQGFEKGIEEGIERGMEAGIERGANEKTLIATKNMLKKGFDAPAIAEILAVPIDQITEMVDAMKDAEIGK